MGPIGEVLLQTNFKLVKFVVIRRLLPVMLRGVLGVRWLTLAGAGNKARLRENTTASASSSAPRAYLLSLIHTMSLKSLRLQDCGISDH